MPERIRDLRKAIGLTQQEFADRLGVKRNTVALYETGKSGISDGIIKSICREFGVSEEWLRTGEGEMFVPRTKNQVITDFMADLVMEDDSFKKRIIEALAQLDAKDWEELERIALKVLERKNGEQD